MGQSPFGKRPSSADPGAARRRSTRVDFATPVILTGRDASGQTFREETETATVNLQGCKLRTRYQILVGMLVSIENPGTGESGKAICVWVGETPAGQRERDIAIQLLNPGNIWGLENPPADWETVAAELGGRSSAPGRAPAVAKIPARPVSPAPVAAEPPRVPAGGSSIELQFAELEQRSAQLMEYVLQILRKQAEETQRAALEEFEQRLRALVEEADGRMTQRAEKVQADFESFLQTLRADVADQLTARTQRVVDSAEDELRSKVAELFSSLLKPAPGILPGKPTGPPSKK